MRPDLHRFTLTRRLQDNTSATGLWIRHDPNREPDVVIYYIHGMRDSSTSFKIMLPFLDARLHDGACLLTNL
jgi:hypothetical protein